MWTFVQIKDIFAASILKIFYYIFHFIIRVFMASFF